MDADNNYSLLNPQSQEPQITNLLKGFIKLSPFSHNSSIWVRLVDNQEEETANQEFAYFKEIGLYDYPTAKQFLEYHLRIQEVNRLEDFENTNNSSTFTPILYGDEVQAKKILTSNYVELQEGKGSTVNNPDFEYLKSFHNIAFRILLIDSNICLETPSYISVSEIKEESKVLIRPCENCNLNIPCKLKTIKQLMDDGKNKSTKRDIFDGICETEDGKGKTKDYFYWKEKDIETYYCPSVIKDFIDDESEDISNISKGKIAFDFAPESTQKSNVQIVGVRDVRTALLLLSRLKFDIIFCDYLLDKNQSGKQEYVNQLFDYLTRNYKDDPTDKRKETLRELRNTVLSNRGPLNKFWIFPISGFNSTFISDLVRNHINLIDNKWNISYGADPINTPWQFLYHLNLFLELQLRSCVYFSKDLITFLLYTCIDFEKHIKKHIEKNGEEGNCFDEFRQFTGAEYATFMKRYGSRKLIERDAVNQNELSNKSFFATYISKQFYNNPEYSTETELNRLMQNFYHWASSMFNDRYGRQRLRENYEQMRIFIAYNQLEDELSDEEKKELKRGLAFLHTVIDSEFNIKKIHEWMKVHPIDVNPKES